LRYGLIRETSYLPTPEWQRRTLEGLKCEVIQQLSGEDFLTDQRIGQVLFQLSKGDEIVVHNVAIFARTMAQAIRVLHSLLELDVTVLVGPEADRINARDNVLDVLAILAGQEHQRYTDAEPLDRTRVQGGSQNPLSRYQIEYARKLYSQGSTLRSIGMLFQVSPNEIWKAIAPQGVLNTARARDDA